MVVFSCALTVLGCIFLLERNELEGHRGKEFLEFPGIPGNSFYGQGIPSNRASTFQPKRRKGTRGTRGIPLRLNVS